MPEMSLAALRGLLPQMSGANFGTASPQELADMPLTGLDKAVQGAGQGIAQQVMTPGALMKPNPYESERGSERWQWYEDAKNKAEMNWAPEMAMTLAGGAGVVPAEANSLRMGIKAYHGSPHDFDAFDLSKIGTGEGAQAYGHGLYFAESEPTAKFYRDNLSRDKDRILETGGSLPAWVARTLESGDQNAVGEMRRTFQSRLAEARKQLADPNTVQPWMVEANIPRFHETLKAIDDYAQGVPLKPSGKMYEVNINADPAHFLDWDRPLSQQHPNVQAALERVNPGVTEEGRTIKSVLPVDTQVASQLRDAGIPGIKYLDQGSRGAGQGSSNYVVFNDKLIDIMRKYGLAGLAPLAGYGAMAGQDQQQ